ncbi:sulfite exporter TauE/SafE family protein [Dongia sp.]|uniref:sulfite exporter TauE/SafE family protein n=1 Tax=Dongia sp. TaxID=1977262 RepID=UPI0035B006AA
MLELAKGLGEHCVVVIEGHGSIILAMLLAGLVGSLTHCAGMCGPLVAAQSLERAAMRVTSRGEAWRRLAGGALIPYQLGRTTTYMALGAVAALPVAAGDSLLSANWLPPLLLWGAAAIFLWQGLAKLDAIPASLVSSGSVAGATTGPILSLLRPLRAMAGTLMRQPTGMHGYLLGILLGFLPCGLLYGAIVAAAATGDPLAAAFAMLAFAVGTFPLSWAIGYGSRFATQRFRSKLKVPLGLLMIFNAVLLTALSLPLL